MTEQEKLNQLISTWNTNPILGIRQLFDVEPTDQQARLIQSAWKQDARTAVSSCQGAGKTSSLAWLTFLFLLCKNDCRILITSPSYQQLSRVFRSEIGKWHYRMPSVIKDQFFITKERIALKGREEFQFASMVTASAEHEENLQGGHAQNYVILADEASGIDERVFDILLGTLGTELAGQEVSQSFIMTSNPLRAAGRFYEIFSRELANWDRLYFSAYDSPVIKEKWIQEMADTYGEDSDIFRVRVLGKFPRTGSTQFFSADTIRMAENTELPFTIYGNFPKILGVDVAKFGDDKTVFVLRQGPKLLDIREFSGLDNMEVVGEIQKYFAINAPAVINIDATGLGSGVYDRAKELRLPVFPVINAQRSTDPMQYFNLRAQLYGLARQWLENGADIPRDDTFRKQLLSVEYGYNKKMQLQLLGKKEIKAKGESSPDIPDALTMTFAAEAINRHVQRTQPRRIRKTEYLWA